MEQKVQFSMDDTNYFTPKLRSDRRTPNIIVNEIKKKKKLLLLLIEKDTHLFHILHFGMKKETKF